MTIVIVGGGKVGYYLAKTLAPERHHIVLLEADHDHCDKIASELDQLGVGLICGDGTELNTLRDAGINGLNKSDSIGSLGQNGAAGGMRQQDGQQGMPGNAGGQSGNMGNNQERGNTGRGGQSNGTQSNGITSPAGN